MWSVNFNFSILTLELFSLAVPEVPENIYLVSDCPHDWLFPRCAAVVSASTFTIAIVELPSLCFKWNLTRFLTNFIEIIESLFMWMSDKFAFADRFIMVVREPLLLVSRLR